MTADLPDPSTDPAGYVLAVAEERERRAKAAATESPSWRDVGVAIDAASGVPFVAPADTAEHIAAEANPGHTLEAVRHWRSIVERHSVGHACVYGSQSGHWHDAVSDTYAPNAPTVRVWISEPCPDLLAVVAAARAYAEPTA
jgi:hypothetical protein